MTVGTATLERAEALSDEARDLAREWVCLVWDDPVNTMSYVTYVFQTYFGFPKAKAEQLMLRVHNTGKAAVASGEREAIETHVAAMHGYGLWSTMDQL